jgi:protein involved in polysaccharide export with SLBB domain
MRGVLAVLVLLTLSASAREPSKKFQGWYHGYFEQYAAADVPPDAADHILVIGFVKKPGIIAPTERLTVTESLAQCGGLADFADRQHIGVWKNGHGRFIIVNARAIDAKQQPDLTLQKGDMIIVTGRWMLGL